MGGLRRASPGATNSEISRVSWSPAGDRIAFLTLKGEVLLYDIASGAVRLLIEYHEATKSLSWGRNGDLLVVGGILQASGAGVVGCCDLRTGDVRMLPAVGKQFCSVACSPDGSKFVAGTCTETAIWDVQSGRRILDVEEGHPAHSLTWSPDGHWIAGIDVHRIRVFEARTGKMKQLIYAHAGRIFRLNWSQDGRWLASCGEDGRIRVWNPMDGTLEFAMPGHRTGARDMAWSPGDNWHIASVGRDHSAVTVWDGRMQSESRSLPGRQVAAWSPNGAQLATSKAEATSVVILDPENGKHLREFPTKDIPKSIAWNRQGTLIGSVDRSGALQVWETETWRKILNVVAHSDSARSLSWNPDGTRLATAGMDRVVRVWDVESGDQVLELRGHIQKLGSVAWSPDGKLLASASWDQVVCLWDMPSGQLRTYLRRRLVSHGADGPHSIAWSPSGDRLAGADARGGIVIWDREGNNTLQRLLGHPASVRSIAWSTDGSRLASAGEDQTVRIWDTSTGREVLTLPWGGETIFSVAWSGDGQRLAAASWTALEVWEADASEATLGAAEFDTSRQRETHLAHSYDQLLQSLSVLRRAHREDPQAWERQYAEFVQQADALERTFADIAPAGRRLDLAFDVIGLFCARVDRLDQVEPVVERLERELRRFNPPRNRQLPNVLNEYAWTTLTDVSAGEVPRLRALAYAALAVRVKPSKIKAWRTLGLGYYHAKDWRSCVEATEEHLRRRTSGSAWDWILLALAHWHLGERTTAQQFYSKALEWRKTDGGSSPALERFFEEAKGCIRN